MDVVNVYKYSIKRSLKKYEEGIPLTSKSNLYKYLSCDADNGTLIPEGMTDLYQIQALELQRAYVYYKPSGKEWQYGLASSWGDRGVLYAKYTYTSMKYISKSIKKKGTFLKEVFSTSLDTYPKNGEKDGYWYEFVG